jgi:hypothetical protein
MSQEGFPVPAHSADIQSIPSDNCIGTRHARLFFTLPFFLLLLALWHSRQYMTTATGGGFLSLNKQVTQRCQQIDYTLSRPFCYFQGRKIRQVPGVEIHDTTYQMVLALK